jgi:DNA ligase-1
MQALPQRDAFMTTPAHTGLSLHRRFPTLSRGLGCAILALLLVQPLGTAAAEDRPPAPALMLAQVWHHGLAVQDYWVSEKYDGVRGYWDGRRLISRGGQVITAPPWFTAGWPATPLDGELWAGHGAFAHAQSTTRQAQAGDAAWKRMRFMVFDLPAAPGSFDQRLPRLRAVVAAIGQDWVQAVPQWRVTSEAELQRQLAKVVAAGGEGLVLHKADAPYRAGRSGDLLKLKPYDDAEGQVVGYKPGKGQWQGQTGALLLQTREGLRFALGAGLTAELRRQPPPLGSWVTYRYQGLHNSGLPRFARFLRLREDMDSNGQP